MLHRIGQVENLFSPLVESPDSSKVGMSVTWGTELEQKLFDILLSCLICVDLREELSQFNLVETYSFA